MEGRCALPLEMESSLPTPQLDFQLFLCTMFCKADEMPFSTDYMEWDLRSSEQDRERTLELLMSVNKSNEAPPQHHGEQLLMVLLQWTVGD